MLQRCSAAEPGPQGCSAAGLQGCSHGMWHSVIVCNIDNNIAGLPWQHRAIYAGGESERWHWEDHDEGSRPHRRRHGPPHGNIGKLVDGDNLRPAGGYISDSITAHHRLSGSWVLRGFKPRMERQRQWSTVSEGWGLSFMSGDRHEAFEGLKVHFAADYKA